MAANLQVANCKELVAAGHATQTKEKERLVANRKKLKENIVLEILVEKLKARVVDLEAEVEWMAQMQHEWAGVESMARTKYTELQDK